MTNHIPDLETARECFVDGAAGEFLAEDFNALIRQVQEKAAYDALSYAGAEIRKTVAGPKENKNHNTVVVDLTTVMDADYVDALASLAQRGLFFDE